MMNAEKRENQIPRWIDIDLVLSQNKCGQFQFLKQLADKLRVPLISMEHTLPMPGWSASRIKTSRDLSGDLDVFVSENNRNAWGYPDTHGYVNHTGVDLDVFTPQGLKRNGRCLSVANDWVNRDWCCGFHLWEDVIGDMLPVTVVGDTPGLSKPAKDIPELVRHYNESSVYLNTTTVSSLPTVILEAMACGCPVVSTATCLIPEIIIEHGVNGFCSNDPSELRDYCNLLLNDAELAKKIGDAGRRTVEEKFSLTGFVKKWNEIFQMALEIQK